MKSILTALALSFAGAAHAATSTIPLVTITSEPINTGIRFQSKHTYRVQVSTTILEPLAYRANPFTPLLIVQEDWNPLAQIDPSIIVAAIDREESTVPLDLRYKPRKDVIGESLYVRVVDSPATIDYGAYLTITDLGPLPTVKIKKKQLRGAKLALSGIASSEAKMVTVTVNGKSKKARGSEIWNVIVKLKTGKNRISVVAYDADGQASKPVKLTFKGR